MTNWALMLCLLAAEDPFQSQVRPTEPLTPEQQRGTFHLPAGFEIQLFASEPELQKPMNMAFDGAGRLWVSGSVEYPFAAEEGSGRDTIKVLEDTDGDGRADKITTFVDGLNIPIGLYPYRHGVIAYSIPNIWFFGDRDGDGRADQREVLYGPLGTPRDTHGMQNAFRRGLDGWLYICHGFSNESVVRGRDGSEITLQSGNTYRVRPDGSRVEQFTWGQVNPFGSTWTVQGDLITADCHSHPLTLLLRGGYYSSFGKPHDGLGYVPPLMEHTHGSTAIAGAAFSTGSGFPADFQQQLFVGNVMTSRVHRDALVYSGSTARAVEQPDLLTSDDPWFRPVDLQFGPDGALYVADFYNRVIGHYEVPLTHPGRDKHRARIWRITYRGQGTHPASPAPRLDQASAEQLVQALADPNLTVRLLAGDQLSDRIGPDAVPALKTAWEKSSDARSGAHCLWALHRLGALDSRELQAAGRHAEPLLRLHAQKILAERPVWDAPERSLARAGLADQDPFVRRAAADAMGQHPDLSQPGPLRQALLTAAPDDTHLRHVLRMALRNQLRLPGAFEAVTGDPLTEEERAVLTEAALGVPSEEAASFLLAQVRAAPPQAEKILSYLSHAARHAAPQEIESLVELARRYANSEETQVELLVALQQALARRSTAAPPSLRGWAEELAANLLQSAAEPWAGWVSEPANGPWGLERRSTDDGQQNKLFLSSLPGGEQRTGVLRSPVFSLPAQLQFYLCGHLGFPNQTAIERNRVRLRLADSGDVVADALPLRNDTAHRLTWDLTRHAGQRGYVELVDGLDLNAYAWLAVSGFEPEVIKIPASDPRQVAQRQQTACLIAGEFQLTSLLPALEQLLLNEAADPSSRAAAAQALGRCRADGVVLAAAGVLGDAALGAELRNEVCRQLAAGRPEERSAVLGELMKVSPARLQSSLALRLAESLAGSELLLSLVEKGQASPRLLQLEPVRQRLIAARLEGIEDRIEMLTANLPPVAEQTQALINDRRSGFAAAPRSITRGQELFQKHCVSCHQVQGKGSLVGPQLDGIGNRGVERLIEDILDPARNVDVAFFATLFTLADGRVLVGLPRREEGNALIVVNPEGKELVLSRDSIDDRQRLTTSIMPANFGETLSPAEFYDLLEFLNSLREKREGNAGE